MIETQVDAQELAEFARARAAFSSFLTVHFVVLPDEQFVQQMRGPEVSAMLKALPNDGSVNEDMATGAALMDHFLETTRSDTPAELSEKLGVDRTRIYRGLSPTYGPPPPYEMVWSQTWPEMSLLPELARIYRENGLGPSAEIIDRLDYAGLELEFIHTLATREAAAWEAGDTAAAQALLQTQQQFFSEHLEQWVLSFVERVLAEAKTDFYHGHLLMLRGFILEQAEVFSLSAPARPA